MGVGGWVHGIHTERRKGEVHINPRKTFKSFSGLSHLSVVRLSEVRLPPASITARVRGRKPSPAWGYRWHGRVVLPNRFTSVGWYWDLGQQLFRGEKKKTLHLKLT